MVIRKGPLPAHIVIGGRMFIVLHAMKDGLRTSQKLFGHTKRNLKDQPGLLLSSAKIRKDISSEVPGLL